ncbi:MAG TPA: hypothetical protein VJZ72_06155 [Candidatus Limnocylindrales bacterium]|nr:hypothetical protein [Candidatus Limnocylindrales bacterium]
MRATRTRLEAYLFALVTDLERLGAALSAPAALQHDGRGRVAFDLRATLASTLEDRPADLRLTEVWVPAATSRGARGRRTEVLERVTYGYELIDRARDRRRAFHRHDVDYFRGLAEVEVHEHCEEPLGDPGCRHFFGRPVRDGYEAIRLLLAAWSEPGRLGCDLLECIDAA